MLIYDQKRSVMARLCVLARKNILLLTGVLVLFFASLQFFLLAPKPQLPSQFTVNDSRKLYLLLKDQSTFQKTLNHYLDHERGDIPTLSFLRKVSQHHNDIISERLILSRLAVIE